MTRPSATILVRYLGHKMLITDTAIKVYARDGSLHGSYEAMTSARREVRRLRRAGKAA